MMQLHSRDSGLAALDRLAEFLPVPDDEGHLTFPLLGLCKPELGGVGVRKGASKGSYESQKEGLEWEGSP